MKIVAYLAMVALCLTAGADAQSGYGHGTPTESHITTHNDTDMGVWITAYSPRVGGGKIEGAWMVKAHSEDTHGLRALIVDVRAEINAGGCSGANRLDSQLGTTNTGKYDGKLIYRLNGFVRHTGGKCTFTT